MRAALDTNILLRACDTGHPSHSVSIKAPEVLPQSGRSLCVGAQTVYEFLAVATRPRSENGFGMSHADARARIDSLLAGIEVLFDTSAVIDKLKDLFVTHRVTGKKIHDAHLADWKMPPKTG